MTGPLELRFGTRTAMLVGGLAVPAALTVTVPTPEALRAAAVLAFVLVAPGAAIAGLLRIRTAAPWAMVTSAGSIAVGVVVSELAALAGWWQPRVLLVTLAVVCTAAGVLAWRLDHGHPRTQEIA